MKLLNLLKDYLFCLKRREINGLVPLTREAEKMLRKGVDDKKK